MFPVARSETHMPYTNYTSYIEVSTNRSRSWSGRAGVVDEVFQIAAKSFFDFVQKVKSGIAKSIFPQVVPNMPGRIEFGDIRGFLNWYFICDAQAPLVCWNLRNEPSRNLSNRFPEGFNASFNPLWLSISPVFGTGSIWP